MNAGGLGDTLCGENIKNDSAAVSLVRDGDFTPKQIRVAEIVADRGTTNERGSERRHGFGVSHVCDRTVCAPWWPRRPPGKDGTRTFRTTSELVILDVQVIKKPTLRRRYCGGRPAGL